MRYSAEGGGPAPGESGPNRHGTESSRGRGTDAARFRSPVPPPPPGIAGRAAPNSTHNPAYVVGQVSTEPLPGIRGSLHRMLACLRRRRRDSAGSSLIAAAATCASALATQAGWGDAPTAVHVTLMLVSSLLAGALAFLSFEERPLIRAHNPAYAWCGVSHVVGAPMEKAADGDSNKSQIRRRRGRGQ
jgi:hypothetical protein